MKTRKLIVALGLVVLLLVGSVLVASAADKIKLTGSANNTYFGLGWEWIDANVTVDPMTGDADGKLRYRVYEYADDPKVFYRWTGEPVCGALGDIDGVPTLALVIQIQEVRNIPEEWVGRYAKITVTDGGENASQDLFGIVVWDFENNMPVSEQPTCKFAEPFIAYSSQNGNLTIHD
jgi:hypothetical protein